MDNRRLHVWQPVTCLERGRVFEAKCNYPNSGLCITLIDINGTEVDIIYDKVTQIQDYVWAFRHIGEIPGTYLNEIPDDEMEKESSIVKTAAWFYKMSNSDYIEWFDQLPWLGSKDIPGAEHHIYAYGDGVFEVISDYEPRFVIRTKS
ncbi:hypothetical protein [Lysinibacillus piscis]|uniref:ASCH domain-containing protein n=1 Tax=Lysinibacillus piscis TaxID=2518931 RepID=A0ABQ5NNM3_9BACI|nr:hypothetical protein [Lysinibacillus sp. KH24]GLC89718.1 hypothetical protein LYSBPC_28450 [Lysinibacillus sp. KH24]